MDDQSAWQEVEVPGTHVLARLFGRGRILMDPASAVAMKQLERAFMAWARIDWNLIPTDRLQELLGILMRCATHVSDELDRRTLQ